MINLKDKEENLLRSLSKLDSITDLVQNSKRKIVDLEQLKIELEQEKLSLRSKLSTLDSENIVLKESLKTILRKKFNIHSF